MDDVKTILSEEPKRKNEIRKLMIDGEKKTKMERKEQEQDYTENRKINYLYARWSVGGRSGALGC